MSEIRDAVLVMGEFFNKNLGDTKLELYVSSLRDMKAPIPVIVKAIYDIMQEKKMLPTINETREFVRIRWNSSKLKNNKIPCDVCDSSGAIPCFKIVDGKVKHQSIARCHCDNGLNLSDRILDHKEVRDRGYKLGKRIISKAKSPELAGICSKLAAQRSIGLLNTFDLIEKMYELHDQYPNAGFEIVGKRMMNEWEDRLARNDKNKTGEVDRPA